MKIDNSRLHCCINERDESVIGKTGIVFDGLELVDFFEGRIERKRTIRRLALVSGRFIDEKGDDWAFFYETDGNGCTDDKDDAKRYSDDTFRLIEDAVRNEYDFAVENYGKGYHSDHEAYAVLKEEIEEAEDEFSHARECMKTIWGAVKANDDDEIRSLIPEASRSLLRGIYEMTQCLAVMRKWEEGKEK